MSNPFKVAASARIMALSFITLADIVAFIPSLFLYQADYGESVFLAVVTVITITPLLVSVSANGEECPHWKSGLVSGFYVCPFHNR